jgi:xylulose-5-phosphate/fructose-6-phosphate phosphoketolase
MHGRPNPERFHVRGFVEQGTTTTPFDMVSLNAMSRYHLAAEAIRRSNRLGERAQALVDECRRSIDAAVAYSREHMDDPPEIRDWSWSDA